MTSSTALPTSRAGLLDELDQLHRERGAAVLDGVTFDGSRLAAIEQALITQDDAELVRRERERATASTAEAERVAGLHASITAADAERLAALAGAQAAFDFAIGEFGKVLALTDRIRAAGTALRGTSSLALEHRETERRISRLIAAGLTEIGRVQEFGDLSWHGTPPRCTDWINAERAAADPAIALLLGAGTGAEVAGRPARLAPASLNGPDTSTETDTGTDTVIAIAIAERK